MNYAIDNPFAVILNQIGTGLNGGEIFIGVAGQDPEVSPVPVYWDAAGTIEAFQPLNVIGGYIQRAGTPAVVYGPAPFSIRVRDRFGVQVFYEKNASGYVGDLASARGAGMIGFDDGETYASGTVGAELKSKADRDLGNLKAVNATLTDDSLTYPVGNELETYSRVSLTTDDARVGKREFSFSFGGTYSLDTTNTDPADEGKVLHYWGVKARLAVGKVWTLNPLLTLDSTLTALKYANVCEFDLNNFSGVNYGSAAGLAGLTQPSAYGVTISGASTGALGVTAALGIIGHGATAIFNRGFIVGPATAIQAAFDDYSSASASYRDLGTHSLGMDLSGATYSAGWAYVPNGSSLLAKTSGAAPSRLLNLNASNVLLIGDPSNHANVDIERTLRPSADNIWQCGETSRRWSSVWSVNGTIQTSDATLKTDIAPIDPGKSGLFIDALTPKSWKWIVGGQVPVTEKQAQEVQVGVETVNAKIGKEDREIEIQVPVMEMREVDVVTGYQGVPGRRTHFGALACDVKAAFEAAGFDDFGGYVLGEDGVEAVRPDQLLAIALTELKSLRRRVAALEAR